jgi:hypothetical protein
VSLLLPCIYGKTTCSNKASYSVINQIFEQVRNSWSPYLLCPHSGYMGTQLWFLGMNWLLKGLSGVELELNNVSDGWGKRGSRKTE